MALGERDREIPGAVAFDCRANHEGGTFCAIERIADICSYLRGTLDRIANGYPISQTNQLDALGPATDP